MTEIAIKRGLHCDDDMEEIVNILIDQVWGGLQMDKNKVGYQQALMKNFESLGKEKVSVIHSAFGDKPHVVAFVEVDKSLSDEDKCEQVSS